MENISTNVQGNLLIDKRAMPVWMDRYASLAMMAAMVGSDLVGILLAGTLAVALRWVLIGPFHPDLLVWIVPVAIMMVIKFSLQHLYPGIGLGVVEEFRSLTISISMVFFVVSAVSLMLHEGEEMSRFVFVVFWLTSLATVPGCRLVVRHVMCRMKLWGEPVAIIGAVEPAVKLYEHFRKDPKIGLRPVMILTPEKDVREGTPKLPVYPIEKLGLLRQKYHVRVAAVAYEDLNEVEEIVSRYRETFERIALFDARGNHFFFNKMKVQQYGSLVSLEVHHRLLDPWAQAFKRMIDVVMAGAALLLLLPLFVMMAGLIWIDSPGRILYRQTRVGKGGKRFTMFKFRTMHLKADEVMKTTLANDRALSEEWEKYQKLKRDPRITRVGGLLRRFSIDELAQLWNVLRGEMSLVGPRPIMLDQQNIYGENYQHYVRVVPGISGLWQISGRNQNIFSRRAEMDMEYVMSWSVWLDIYIIVRTFWVVLRRDGAC